MNAQQCFKTTAKRNEEMIARCHPNWLVLTFADERLQGPVRAASEPRLKLISKLTGTTFCERARCMLPRGKQNRRCFKT